MKRIIRFTASWCAPCKILAKQLETMDISLPIEVVDIDENEDLALQYKIRGVPTLILLDDEEEIKRMVGVKSPTELQNWIG